MEIASGLKLITGVESYFKVWVASTLDPSTTGPVGIVSKLVSGDQG